MNVKKPKAYYTALKPEDICGCDYCRNYIKKVKDSYPLFDE